MSDSDEVFDVERIVDDRIFNGKKQYLIKWVGYSESENTWEFESNLMCSELLKEYMENKKKKKSPPKKPQLTKKESLASSKKEPVKSAKSNNKQQNVPSNKSNESTKNANKGPFLPSEIQTFSNEWDDLIEEVTGAFMGPNNVVQIQFKFKDGSIGVATNTEVRYKAPFKLLDFYEANLSFPE